MSRGHESVQLMITHWVRAGQCGVVAKILQVEWPYNTHTHAHTMGWNKCINQASQLIIIDHVDDTLPYLDKNL